MNLQEPKVEFVPIDESVFTQSASGCPEGIENEDVGGGQRCVGSQPDATVCPDWNSDNPW